MKGFSGYWKQKKKVQGIKSNWGHSENSYWFRGGGKSPMTKKLPRLLHPNSLATGRHAPVVPMEIYLLHARVHKTTRERLHWKPSAANAWGFTLAPLSDSLKRLEIIEHRRKLSHGCCSVLKTIKRHSLFTCAPVSSVQAERRTLLMPRAIDHVHVWALDTVLWSELLVRSSGHRARPQRDAPSFVLKSPQHSGARGIRYVFVTVQLNAHWWTLTRQFGERLGGNGRNMMRISRRSE